jgi:hypothetical protein
MSEVSQADTQPRITLPITYAQLDLAKSLTIRQLRDGYPQLKGKGGKRICINSLRRWIAYGYHPIGQDGPRVVLPALKINGDNQIMPEWVDWFLKTCAELRDQQMQRQQAQSNISQPRSEKKASRAESKARNRLRQEGFDV